METQPPHRNTKLERELRSPGVSQSSFPVTDGDGWPSSVVSLLWQLLVAFGTDQNIGFNWAPKAYARIAKQVLSCFLWPFATKQCQLFTEWFIVTLSFVLALKTINLGSPQVECGQSISQQQGHQPREHWKRCQWSAGGREGRRRLTSSLDVLKLQKSDSKSSQKSEWTISSFSGNFNLQPSQVSCRAQQVQSQFLELVQSRAKEPKLIPSLRLAYVPLALSRRIGFIGLLQTAWDSSLVAKRFGCKLLGCKRTGLALIEASKEHFRHLFPVSNTNSSMGFVE